MVMLRDIHLGDEESDFFAPIAFVPENNKDAIVLAVKQLSPWAEGGASSFEGGKAHAAKLLDDMNPADYAHSRNHLDGSVTKLSPFIRHGVLSLNDVRNAALDKSSKRDAEKFIQQLAWRDYWQRLYAENPEMIWHDVEPYKTGFDADDYVDELPSDIESAQTGVACIDAFLRELLESGTMHNHARLYVAGYICHWRRVKWQAGAKFFLKHLLDGDPASNNLSWQWAASTFSHKPYYYNLDNVSKFSGDNLDTSPENNAVLDGSYEALYETLFPNLEPKP